MLRSLNGISTAALLLGLLSLASASCNRGAEDPYAVHVAPLGSSHASAPIAAPSPDGPRDPAVAEAPTLPPPGDVCAKIPATRGNVPFRDPNAQRSLAGQMTEQAAQAKRLFDSERWKEAELALARVASGDSGDDEGNKQIADYHRAIALYRTKRLEESIARFRAFARNPGHLKFQEALLWIVKIAREAPQLVQLEDVALYTPDEIARFDNPHQRDVFGAASYLVGHERYEEGNLSEAARLFEAAKRAGPWQKEAERCLARTGSQGVGPRRP
ncbi:MAG: hypothetical protein JST00_43155 [Deltaproteobacteria bacterium]|nr:hypothetical protein [Deltaproteobacteria bacterium]